MRKFTILLITIFTALMFVSCYTVDRLNSYSNKDENQTNYIVITDDNNSATKTEANADKITESKTSESTTNKPAVTTTTDTASKTSDKAATKTVSSTSSVPESKPVTTTKKFDPTPKVELNKGKTEAIPDLGYRTIIVEGFSEPVDEKEWRTEKKMECYALIPTYTPYNEKPKVVSQLFQCFENGKYTGFIAYDKSSYGEVVTIKREGLNIRYNIGKDNQGKPKYMILVQPDGDVKYFDCSEPYGDTIWSKRYNIVQLY